MASGQYTKALELAVASGAALAVGTYNVEIVATYASGKSRWPENDAALPLAVRAPGST